jgi:hypothetical protein
VRRTLCDIEGCERFAPHVVELADESLTVCEDDYVAFLVGGDRYE